MVLARILDALKLDFVNAVAKHGVVAAEYILVKLSDNVRKQFLQFLDVVLPIFNNYNLNKEMQ